MHKAEMMLLSYAEVHTRMSNSNNASEAHTEEMKRSNSGPVQDARLNGDC